MSADIVFPGYSISHGNTKANANSVAVNMAMLRGILALTPQTPPNAGSASIPTRLAVGRRAVGASNQQFQIIQQLSLATKVGEPATVASGNQLSFEAGRVQLSGTNMLDGEYVILVSVGMAGKREGGTDSRKATILSSRSPALAGDRRGRRR